MSALASSTVMHSSSVSCDNDAVLIIGRSGTGKSSLALELISRGAILVADDRTLIQNDGINLSASPVPETAGKIEARGVGILSTPCAQMKRVVLVVDMDKEETLRLPTKRYMEILGYKLPLIHAKNNPVIAGVIMVYLKGGRYV